MAAPSVNCIVNFSSGASFGQAMIVGSGVLGVNVLADSAAVTADVSNEVQSVSITRAVMLSLTNSKPVLPLYVSQTLTATLTQKT
jgi:hypothetical protein